MEFQDFLPTEEELECGPTKAAPPPDAECLTAIEKTCRDAGCVDPFGMMTRIAPLVGWDGLKCRLTVSNLPLGKYLEWLIRETPSLAHPDSLFRIDQTLTDANLRCDVSLLSTRKLKAKFIRRYGEERLAEIQRDPSRCTVEEAKRVEREQAARRVARMKTRMENDKC